MRLDRQTDMTKLIVALRSFANAPDKGKMAALGCFYIPGPFLF